MKFIHFSKTSFLWLKTIGFRLRFRPKPKKWFPTLTNLILVTFTFYFLFRKENELTKSSYVAHKVMNP